ncbi:MAG TPA: HAD-IIIC family phosphatase [Solirubrobacteraceae bacterium]|jgi:FkbH-like protein
MKLAEALEIVRRPPAPEARPFSVSLACGFETLHLSTFLAAELTLGLDGARVQVGAGLFDDLSGNVERAAASDADAVAVVVEWPDLDPRLGLRRTGGWLAEQLDEIVAGAELALGRIEQVVAAAAEGRRVACVMPTLGLPPVFPQRPAQSGRHELALRRLLAEASERLAGHPTVSVASRQRIDELSAPHARRDVKAELSAGFPYSLGHASALAAVLGELLCAGARRKGLITDLDDTLWAGLLDEQGAHGVSWIEGAHRHGLYQQLLASLASAGILIAVASRNDPELVAQALGREDLLVSADVLYPVTADWGPKSRSIRRVLDAWNIGAEAAVFVDDDPLARDEAATQVPGLLTLAPPADDDALWSFLEELRTLFGTGEVSAEDGVRLSSIRSMPAFGADARDGSDFLAHVAGTVQFATGTDHSRRALELVNKSNQFNLNGLRLSEADLARALTRGAELVTVSYADRYGPLGVIAALLVSWSDDGPRIDTWAMSCRAFARRIEHHTLRFVFDRFAAAEIAVAFHPTGGNTAIRDFLASLVVEDCPPRAPVRLPRTRFEREAPELVHRVVIAAR